MLEIKLILCPIDFSEFSARAYRHALSLAEHYRSRLAVQHVVELWRYPSMGFAASAELYDRFCESMHENGMEELRKFVKEHHYGEIQPELVVQDGMAPDSILAFAEAHQADVIVMGTHGRRGYDRLMLGSVTDRVMRRARCPVLAVNKLPQDSATETGAPHRIHHLSRVLFCMDFSENSERALGYALSATAEYDAELTLLHVLDEVPGHAKADAAMAAAREQLEKLIPAEARKTLKIKTEVRIGKPYQQIIQYAVEKEIEIIAMGVRGRGALDLAVFGSTTYRVMQLGPCPVLAVQV